MRSGEVVGMYGNSAAIAPHFHRSIMPVLESAFALAIG
jgi:hypothetical protein